MPDAAGSVLFLQTSRLFAADGQVHTTIMRRLPEHGFVVHAACPAPARGRPSSTYDALVAIPDVDVIEASFGPVGRTGGWRGALRSAGDLGRALTSAARLARVARRDGVDVVHCTEKVRDAVFGYAVARASGAALVVHLHIKVGSWFSRPTRWLMHRAGALVAVSEFVGGSAIESGYPPGQVRVALNELEPAGLPGGTRVDDQAAVRAELGLGPADQIVSIVARMTPWKGHRELLDAVADIVDGRSLTVVVVGGSEPEATQLRADAVALGIGEHVRFVGHRTDAIRIIRASDVFAMPSYEEPFGLVYLEAMWGGVPVIGLDNGGTPEVVVDGITGLLSAPGDRAGLAANLAKLLDDPALRDRLGAAGQERVAEHFGADRLAADMAAIYREVIARRSP